MSHGPTRIPSKGVCIYCRRTGVLLTDEHIVPYSLGGQHVILKASCEKCADITKKFEQDVARELWGDARTSYNAPSRRKKERRSHVVLTDPLEGTKKLSIPVGEYPAPMVFYKMSQAGLLAGASEQEDGSAKWVLVAITDEKRLERFEQKHPGKLTATFRHVPDSFARLLAKIGYGQTLCSLDINDFNPICLPFILGSKRNLSYIVGGRVSIEDAVPQVGYRLSNHLFGTKDRAVIIAEIRLVANNATPTYHVVVGDVVGVENVRNVNSKLRASYFVEMPPQFDSPRVPPDSLHWMPTVWPLRHWNK